MVFLLFFCRSMSPICMDHQLPRSLHCCPIHRVTIAVYHRCSRATTKRRLSNSPCHPHTMPHYCQILILVIDCPCTLISKDQLLHHLGHRLVTRGHNINRLGTDLRIHRVVTADLQGQWEEWCMVKYSIFFFNTVLAINFFIWLCKFFSRQFLNVTF